MAGPSVFSRLSNSRFGNFLKSAYQTISNYLKREKGNPEEKKPLLDPKQQNQEEVKPKPESARAELEKNIKNARAEKETSSKEENKQVIVDTQPKIKATTESKNTQEGNKNTQEVKKKLNDLNELLSRYPSSQTTSSTTASPTPSATTENTTTRNSAKLPSSQSPASSGVLSPATSRSGLEPDPHTSFEYIVNNKVVPNYETPEAPTQSSISSRELKELDALAQGNKDINVSLSKQATREDKSPKSSGNSSPTQGVTWKDDGTKYTEGVKERKKLESPASPSSPASPASPASQARTASAGSPTMQFRDFIPEVTKLAEAAARQAQLSGRGAIKAEEDKQRANIQQGHWKQVEAMRTEIATAQPSVVESFFGIAKNIGIGGQTSVEASPLSPAPSNQAIATTDKSPKQERKEIIPVFKENKENSGQGTSSRGSSNTGRTPLSQNNSNRTGSDSGSRSSGSRISSSETGTSSRTGNSSRTGTSSRTGNSSGTQRTTSSITSQQSVTLPGGTKVRGTQEQIDKMIEVSGGSTIRVADRTSAIEEQTRRENSAVAALEKARKELKGAPEGHLPSGVTTREYIGFGKTSGRGAVATLEGVRSFTDGNGNGGRGGSTGR